MLKVALKHVQCTPLSLHWDAHEVMAGDSLHSHMGNHNNAICQKLTIFPVLLMFFFPFHQIADTRDYNWPGPAQPEPSRPDHGSF